MTALWLGQVTSFTGDQLYRITLLWMLVQASRSPIVIAVLAVVETAPMVLVGWRGASVLARCCSARALAALNGCSALVTMILPVLAAAEVPMSVPLLLAMAGVLAALDSLFAPSLQALVPQLWDSEGRQAAIAMLDSTDRISRITGPGCLALLTTLLPRMVDILWVDAGTFAVSCLSLLTLRASGAVPACRDTTADRRHPGGQGWDLARADRNFACALLIRTSCNFAWSAFTIGVPFLLSRHLRLHVSDYGLVLAGYGIGNLLGNTVAAIVRFGRRLMVAYSVAWMVVGCGMIGIGMAGSLVMMVCSSVVAGIGAPLAAIAMDARLAEMYPAGQLVAAQGLTRSSIRMASTVGGFVLAPLIGLSAPITVAASGLWMIGTAGAFVPSFLRAGTPSVGHSPSESARPPGR
jgi:hypothetical protein